MNNLIKRKITELSKVIFLIEKFSDKIDHSVFLIVESFNSNNKLLLCGNGGSAAEAQHIAAEYVSSLKHDFKRKSLPAIALTTDTSFITATGNDFGFDTIFERQIESLGNKGDVLIAITTSGNSENVIRAAKIAKEKGLKVIGLTGISGGKLKDYCDVLFNVPSENTMRIQEIHLFLEHTICEGVENKLFAKNIYR